MKKGYAGIVKSHNLNKNQRNVYGARGFALIATISVMVLLVMIALAMLSLSTIELRQSRNADAQSVAQANARLALMLAIGELQKNAGPDQRVTATASILDSNLQTVKIDDVDHPNWVGVWRSDGLKSEPRDTPFVVADGARSNQALRDRRQALGYQRKNEVLSWLVSGENPDPTTNTNQSEMVAVYKVDELPAGADAKDYNVTVPRVEVGNQSGNTAGKGHFAYWVSDEGTKAKINSRNEYAALEPSKSSPAAGGYYNLLTSQRADFSQIFKSYADLSDEDTIKLITHDQINLADIGSVSGFPDQKSAMKALRHDVTTSSMGLLVDVVNGGLKKDLGVFLNSSGSVPSLGNMNGLDDSDPIIARVQKRETIGPKFASLRSWYQLKDKATGSLGNRKLEMQNPNALPGGPAMNNSGGVDHTQFVQQPIHPVLKEAVYYVNHAYDSNASSRKVYEFIYPRVVLWNPYNVTVQSDEMYVLIDMRLQLDVKYSYTTQDGANASKNFNTSTLWGGKNENTHAFSIPPTEFKPGEALVFTAMPTGSMLKGKAVPFNDPRVNLSANRLSASEDPSELYCFYRQKKETLPSGIDMNSVKLTYGGIFWNGSSPTQSVYLFGRGDGSTPTIDNLGTASFPVLQQIHLDNYSRGNNGRWLPTYYPYNTYNLTQLLGGGVPPDTLNAFGMRFRHIYESHSNRANGALLNEPWYSAPIVHNNVRAGRVHRWSRDNMFGMRYASGAVSASYSGPAAHLYSYGLLSTARQWSPWTDPEVTPHFHDGNYRTAVFTDASFGSSESVYPLFDIPHKDVPIFSLAAFQHVQLTPFVWHPTYAVANSIASPYNELHTTSQTWADERSEWDIKLNQFPLGQNEFTHGLSMANENPYVYDLSYEVNDALWDRYFISSIPANPSSAGWSDEDPLPNSRYVIDPAIRSSGSIDDLVDFHKAASGLLIDGGFNVNSTSVIAWESILRSFNGYKYPTRNDGGSANGEHPYSRFLLPDRGPGQPSDVSDISLWAGHRSLSDSEIRRLAEEIVIEVKKRAPFVSIADFVNRRLQDNSSSSVDYPEIAYAGVIQNAINRAGINESLESTPSSDFTLPSVAQAENYQYGAEYWGGPARTPEPQKYDTFSYDKAPSGGKHSLSETAGASGYLIQGDILQRIGAALTPRSDTFVVRAYGDAVDSNGKLLARAWCEAVVQRTVVPINPDQNTGGLNPVKNVNRNYGRQFEVVLFRWLSPEEI